jgi:hypothetical protein
MTLANIGFVSHASCGQFPEYAEPLDSGNVSKNDRIVDRVQNVDLDDDLSVLAIRRSLVVWIT